MESSSSFSTKEVLGYLWTPQLLKKHERPIPKRLSTIQHQGKAVKGAILEEWVLGSLAELLDILFNMLKCYFISLCTNQSSKHMVRQFHLLIAVHCAMYFPCIDMILISNITINHIVDP